MATNKKDVSKGKGKSKGTDPVPDPATTPAPVPEPKKDPVKVPTPEVEVVDSLTCDVAGCGKTYATPKGLQIHRTKVHGLYRGGTFRKVGGKKADDQDGDQVEGEYVPAVTEAVFSKDKRMKRMSLWALNMMTFNVPTYWALYKRKADPRLEHVVAAVSEELQVIGINNAKALEECWDDIAPDIYQLLVDTHLLNILYDTPYIVLATTLGTLMSENKKAVEALLDGHLKNQRSRAPAEPVE